MRRELRMTMKFGLVTVAAALAAATFALAQGDVILQRQALMKALGPSLRAVFQMLNGEIEFDAAAAEQAMLKVADHGAVLPTLFPKGSHVGTNASELIWEEFDEFVAIYADLEAAGRAGAAAAAADDVEGVR